MGFKASTDGKNIQNVKPFPKLMISEDLETIVLFSEEKKGVVILDSRVEYKVGKYFESFNMEYFRDYNEPITLQNEQ